MIYRKDKKLWFFNKSWQGSKIHPHLSVILTPFWSLANLLIALEPRKLKPCESRGASRAEKWAGNSLILNWLNLLDQICKKPKWSFEVTAPVQVDSVRTNQVRPQKVKDVPVDSVSAEGAGSARKYLCLKYGIIYHIICVVFLLPFNVYEESGQCHRKLLSCHFRFSLLWF